MVAELFFKVLIAAALTLLAMAVAQIGFNIHLGWWQTAATTLTVVFLGDYLIVTRHPGRRR